MAAGNVLRSKGSIWLATMHDIVIVWASAGRQFSLQPQQPWMSGMSKEQLAELDAEQAAEVQSELAKHAKHTYGDRETELVFIGIDLNRQVIEQLLQDALLSPAEFALLPSVWADWDCPIIEGWEEKQDGDHEDST
jgi:G3E family GTPase